jgi:hypothetical protein
VDDFVDTACRCFTQILGELERGIHPPPDDVSVLSFFRAG